MLESLGDKVALVTGAGRGIGRAIALALASRGCSLAVCANMKDEIDKVADEIKRLGAKVLALCLDLSKKEDCVLFVKKALDQYGTIDFLINCVGVLFQKPLLEQSLEEWDTTMNVNLRSYFILTQEVLKIMKEKRDGYIIISPRRLSRVLGEISLLMGFQNMAFKGYLEPLTMPL